VCSSDLTLNQWAIDVASLHTAQQKAITNAPIYEQLDSIDLKSIRAIRTNDTARIAQLESQAVALRAKLV